MKLRVACVQFNPLLGKVEANISKIRSLLSSVHKEIDLLVLPELAALGYNFQSPQEIEPYLETSGVGPSAFLAKELSLKFGCTTVIGYPETFQKTTYNSALVVNEEGNIVYNYRKTHLYLSDKAWGCQENPDKLFKPVSLSLGKGPNRQSIMTSIGICMDLNPYEFEAPFTDFEFASLCWQNNSKLIVVPTAWLSTESPSIQEDWAAEKKKAAAEKFQARFKESPESPIEDSKLPSQQMIDYWILRFFPFLSHPMNGSPRKSHPTTVVINNRTGIEHDVLYGGSSCIFQFNPLADPHEALNATNPSVNVVGSVGRASEEVLYSEIEI